MHNVLLVTLDSVRADFVTERTMPNLVGRLSTRFTQAYANAPCTPASVPSLLTGRYPLSDGHCAFDSETPTLAELASDAGYETSVGHANIQIPRFGFHRGFSNVHDESGFGSDDDGGNPVLAAGQAALSKGGIVGPAAALAKEALHLTTGPIHPHPLDAEVFDAVDLTADEPWFAWLHGMDTHYPYRFDAEDFRAVSDRSYSQKRYARLLTRAMTHVRSGAWTRSLDDEQRAYLRDCYRASLHGADRVVGDLLDDVDLSGTTVVVTSDHGEEFWEHGHFGHAGRSTIPRPMTLYEELLRVPLFVSDDDLPTGSVDAPVSLVDVAATIQRRVGVDDPNGPGTPLEDVEPTDERTIVAHTTEPGDPEDFANFADSSRIGAVVRGNWKYIWNEEGGEELYRLDRDSEETTNLREVEMKTAALLCERIKETMSTDRVISKSGISEGLERQLQKLGYLG